MISAKDIENVYISPGELEDLRSFARRAEIGGISHVRAKAERSRALKEDQLVGILGHYAASMCIFDGAEAFLEARAKADRNPHVGDGGSDLPGNIDVKSSRIRNSARPLRHYKLPVRPHEMSRSTVYVLALVELGPSSALVRLMGWARGNDLPDDVCRESGHPFEGAYILGATELEPMVTILENSVYKATPEVTLEAEDLVAIDELTDGVA